MRTLLSTIILALSVTISACAQTGTLQLGKDTLLVDLKRAKPDTVHDTTFVQAKDTVRLGLLMGAMATPLDSMRAPYSVTSLVMSKTVLTDLAKAKAKGVKVYLQLPRVAYKDTTLAVSLSPAKVKAYLATMPDVSAYVRDGTIVGVLSGDDIMKADEWGPGAPHLAKWDSVAMYWRQKVATTTMLRAKPSQMSSFKWKYVKAGWAQYSAIQRDGPIATYVAKEVAAARAAGICVVLGMNYRAGGDGTSGIVTGHNASGGAEYQMTKDEVTKYGAAMLSGAAANPTVVRPLIMLWQWRSPDVNLRAALSSLRTKAVTTPTPSCS